MNLRRKNFQPQAVKILTDKELATEVMDILVVADKPLPMDDIIFRLKMRGIEIYDIPKRNK